MCGIVAVLKDNDDQQYLRADVIQAADALRHRGPDFGGVHETPDVILAHQRLAIVGVKDGAQPIVSKDGIALAANGEIYNHQDFRYPDFYDWETRSDCEAIIALYVYYMADSPRSWLSKLDGVFAFVLADPTGGPGGPWGEPHPRQIIARDPMGICPLYWGMDQEGNVWAASEMKALLGQGIKKIEEFPPGHFYDSADTKAGPMHTTQFWTRDWVDQQGREQVTPRDIQFGLAKAVRKRLMTDPSVRYGVLLSGGLDSSAVAALVKRLDGSTLDSFAIGLKGSPDLEHAALAASHLGTRHHEIHFTVEEGIDAIPAVIGHLETYDVTTIRAGTPMYLLARHIKAMGIKMVFTGEGSDELFGGYLYFHHAPNAIEFYAETVRKVLALHKYDVLRCNKAMAAWGVEARVPFLDLEFVDLVMGMDPKLKMVKEGRIEKQILRDAMDGLLYDQIRLRQKEQFSDGVGYSWIDEVQAHAETIFDQSHLLVAEKVFPHNTPTTSEGLWYRHVYEAMFTPANVDLVPGGPTIACSTPKAVEWNAAFADYADPSGRAVTGVHKESYE